MKVNSRHLKLASCAFFALGILAMFQEKLGINIDGTTVSLFIVAVLLLILPDLSKLSKFKLWEIEVEFDLEKVVDQFEKQVIAEETNEDTSVLRTQNAGVTWQHYYKEYKEILNSKNVNLEKILRAAQLVELMIVEAGNDFELPELKNSRNANSVIHALHKNKLISDEEMSLFKEFYTLRSQVIHGQIKDISDTLTTRILDLLWRMVKIFA